ncbi:MAG TPA: AarF/ABC1/UbiB kinase family protein [Actinomycetales bacterium]|nr:AarF/ABC1/UbiB kinase family protein [Actinomycetales bacterium]
MDRTGFGVSARARLGSLRRGAALASLPAGAVAIALQGALLRAAGRDAEQVRSRQRRRSAERTRRVLASARGGALKAGQLLAGLEALFPPDPEGTWRRALVSLTDSVDAMPWADTRSVLADDLGPAWRSLLPQLDLAPTAAASIGQVHAGRWHDGRAVAVKVQYPGVAAALRSDLAGVEVATRLAALVARGMTLPPLVREMRVRLAEELDYLHEAEAQRAFAEGFAGDDEVWVPTVVHASPRVLVTEWMEGTPLAHLVDRAARDRAGELYQRFLLSGPARAGRLHTDPHPGNFRLLDDGRLGVLDFGSTLAMPAGMPPTFGALIRALTEGDPDVVHDTLVAEGFVRPGVSVDVVKLWDYLSPFTVPARCERFAFSPQWLRSQFGRVNDPRDPDFAVALRLDMPAEHLFTHRVWLGCVGVLCLLEAEVPVRAELERWLPAFTPPQ